MFPVITALFLRGMEEDGRMEDGGYLARMESSAPTNQHLRTKQYQTSTYENKPAVLMGSWHKMQVVLSLKCCIFHHLYSYHMFKKDSGKERCSHQIPPRSKRLRHGTGRCGRARKRPAKIKKLKLCWTCPLKFPSRQIFQKLESSVLVEKIITFCVCVWSWAFWRTSQTQIICHSSHVTEVVPSWTAPQICPGMIATDFKRPGKLCQATSNPFQKTFLIL